jgi:arylsulfatase A-like enzyme/Flp pilus assembly protein TadD
MSLRHAVLLAATLASIPALSGCNRIEASRSDRGRPVPTGPNVLLVTIDTLRADHVGAYGASGHVTPALDRLAAEGILFENAIAATPLTLPSHSSILTGMSPPEHAVRNNGIFRLDESRETLAERFREAGYDTGAVLGAFVLDARFGLDQGFDFYDFSASSRRASETGYPERPAEEVTDVALRWLGARKRPFFFLWLHYYDPHAAYKPPPSFEQRFPGRPYDGEIAYVDEQVERVFRALRSAGEWHRTLVVVTSDHGESLGEHGERTHAYTLYDAVLRVPLLIRGPGVPAARRVPEVVSAVDVAPTILARAGLAPLGDAGGRDLSPLWRAEPGFDSRPAYAETLATQLDHGWAPLFAMRTDRYLFVRAPRPELYDVESDPGQLTNLLEDPSAAAAEAAGILDRAVDAVLADQRKAERLPLDAETREQLRALGYAPAEGPVPETGTDPKDGLPLLEAYVIAAGEYSLGRLDQAEARATRLLPELPRSPQLHDLLARIYMDQGDLELAIHHAETAVRLVPEAGRHHDRLGLVRLAAGDVDGAVSAYQKAVELDPNIYDSHAGLMWRASLGGSIEDAALAAERAVELAPSDPRIRIRIADTWDRLGVYDRALESYRAALTLDPASPKAHMGLAIQLARLGDVADAELHFSRAGEAAEGADSLMRLAIAWAGRGETARAEEILRELLVSHPDFEASRKVLAVLLQRSGRSDEAARLEAGR